jgi:peptidyl-prolyl cis-trans isomerase A (cyclophilin A)
VTRPGARSRAAFGAALLAGALFSLARPAPADEISLEPEPKPPAPSVEALRGGWRVELTASYSSCDDVKVGDHRRVEFSIAAGKKPGTITLTEKGGEKGAPQSYAGTIGAGHVVHLRAGKQAGLELSLADERLRGRQVVVRKGECAVIWDLVAQRPMDQPLDVGISDPDAGRFDLARALAGIPAEGTLAADIDTAHGTITCDLFPELAPETVANFVGLARGTRAWRSEKDGRWWRYRSFYDGLSFHRVIPGFMVQGGDPLSTDLGATGLGTGGPGYTIPDETRNGLRFDGPGRLAMANKTPGTNSGGSQFFITEVKATQLDGQYTIFGQCGPPDVVHALALTPADANGRPTQPAIMKVRIYRR